MRRREASHSLHAFERVLSGITKKTYVLHLYVTGTTPQSVRAVANIRKICEKYLHGSYRLDVIDLYQQPELARARQIVAAPTLIKVSPLPIRRILGDMSATERVLAGLGLKEIP